MDASSPKKSQSCETIPARKEIHNYHGVVHALNLGITEDELQTNGTLSIIQQADKISIEWRPNDVSVDTECQEEEWAFVNTKSRTRTSSGSVEVSSSKIQGLCIPIHELKSLKIYNKKNKLTLFLRDNRQKLFYFHFENVDNFISALRSVVYISRPIGNNHTFVVHHEKPFPQVAQSFSDLNLSDLKSETVWKIVGDLKHNPYETTLSTFSKLTEYFLYRAPENRPEEGEMVEIFNSSLSSTSEAGIIDDTYHVVSPLGPMELVPRGEALTRLQWLNSLDDEGRIISPDSIKNIIFRGGIDPSLRPEVWKFLLGYFPWNSTRMERIDIMRKKNEEYFRLKTQWKTITLDQESRFSLYRDKKNLVEKDVNRTDRTLAFYAGEKNPNLELLSGILMTYVMYNFDLGYVQGMSDLLSPILTVLDSEVEAFWCFVGFMNIMYHNFDEDQSGMKKQLSQLHTLLTAVAPELSAHFDSHDAGNMCFCFRWLLVWFKREFSPEDVAKLWEVLWTGLPCPNFHLVICAAILDKEKANLAKETFGLTEILKHVNDLSCQLNLDEILMRATAIYNQLEQSTNLTVSTQRVLGLSNDLSKCKSNTTAGNKTSDLSDINIENGYDKSIELNYF